MSQSLATLVAGLSVEIVGDGNQLVEGAQPLEWAEATDMAFLSGKSKFAAAVQSRAGVLFIGHGDRSRVAPSAEGRTLIFADDPKEAFFAALARLKPPRQRSAIGKSPQAFIDPTAAIGKDTNIHPGATIESGVVIGDRCEIRAGVRIGSGCRIGDDVQLDWNVVLYENVLIGNRVTIQAGSVIGAAGFGYRTREGRHERIPHYGTVRLEDDVDIGACSTIDRSVIGETVIGEGTKIDNNVVIAHNCRLGRHNLLVSQVGFAGSVTTGDYVVCAGQVGIADHVSIGAGAILGAKAGVHKDLAGGKTYLGAPAAPIEETTRAVMTMQKLPQLRQSLRELERQVAALRKQVEGGAHSQQPAA